MDLTIRWTINTTQVVLVLIFSMVTQGHGLSSKRQVPPTFLDIGKRNITVHKGELAVLGCKIRNLGPKQVAWRKLPMYYPLTVGTITFATDEDISVEHNILNNDISEWNLVIKRAKTSHTGTYECQISAKRIYTHHVYLNVLDQPAIPEKAITISGTEYPNLHDTITLTCNVTFRSVKPPSIDWFHNGNVIKTHDPQWRNRIQITRYVVPKRYIHSDLIIDRSSMHDSGRYVCRSIDYMSNDRKMEALEVNVLNIPKDPKKRRGGTDTKTEVGEQTGRNSCSHMEYLVSNSLMLFIIFLTLR